MDEEYYIALAKVRMERSKELLKEAKYLFDKISQYITDHFGILSE